MKIFILFTLLFNFATFAQDKASETLEQVQLATTVVDANAVLSELNAGKTPNSNCSAAPGPETASKTEGKLISQIHNIVMIFTGENEIITPELINKILGDPDTLDSTTEMKLEHLSTEMSLKQNQVGNDFDVQKLRDPRTLDSAHFAKNFNSVFTSSELTDLSLYLLSSSGFLSQDGEAWKKLVGFLSEYQGYVLIGAIAGAVATNSIRVPLSGRLFKIQNGKVTGGWYANISGLGISLDPKVSAGFNVKTDKGLTILSGVTTKARDLNLNFEGGVKYASPVLPNGTQNFSGSIMFTKDFFPNPGEKSPGTIVGRFSTSQALMTDHNNYTLSAGLVLKHQFGGNSAAGAYATLRDNRHQLAASLRLETQYNASTHTSTPYVGFVFSKTLDWKKTNKKLKALQNY